MQADRRTSVKVTTIEARVENGQIKLSEPVSLPENATVYVVIPGVEALPKYHFASPRLARPQQAVDFVKEVTEEPRDAVV